MNAQSLKCFKSYNPRMVKFVATTLALFISFLLLSQPAVSKPVQDTFIANISALHWEHWEGFPEGAEIAILRGDQESSWDEAFVRIPAGFQVPHDNHTPRELVLWIQGNFTYVADDDEKRELGPTAYLNLAQGTKHSVRCGDESACLLYLKYDRPYDVHMHPSPATHSARAH